MKKKDDIFEHDNSTIIATPLEEIMGSRFGSYSKYIIQDRALPDARDGLKPVQRRILYAMYEDGNLWDKAYRKSAKTVGLVIGNYHPHGDSSVYDAMVRMSQEWKIRHPQIDMQGNNGSIDDDPAAAMRYTEARLGKISEYLLKDIEKDTVTWSLNFDDTAYEPTVLPASYPNLLVNGITGIAAGYATSIPPHNLNEAIQATIYRIRNPKCSLEELMEYMHGPDFPTGGMILGRAGIRQAYETGRGSIMIRCKHHLEEMDNGKTRIVVTEVPYQVNKANLITKIADLVREKQIDGITYLNDESNREGIRIVIELRKDVQVDVVLNQLFRMTSLQTSFGVNMLALHDRSPKQMGIKELLGHYIDHQIDVTVRRTKYDLKKAEDRAHILEGLRIALDHIDEIIHIIRSSKNDSEARSRLMENFELSEIQANAILEMRLRRLTGLERDKIENEYQELLALIIDLKDILANHDRVLQIIRDELTEVKNKYGDERRTEISDADYDMQDEDLIPVEDIVITMTTNGYIKRMPTDTYHTQNRGGRGIKGMAVNEDDIVEMLVPMSTHDFLLLFTNIGKVYRIKGYKVPNASRTAKGLPVVNLLNLDKDEKVKALVPMKVDHEAEYLMFVTKNGLVKRVPSAEFASIRQNGKIAITLREGDELVGVKETTGDDEIIIAGSNGKAVRFHEDGVRPMGRSASGVKGFNVDGAVVVGMATSRDGTHLLAVSENGYGKRTAIDEYRMTTRGAKGVKTINITPKTGDLVSVRAVNGDEDAMIVTNSGIIIRIEVDKIGIYSRNTQGVKLINVAEHEVVAKVAIVEKQAEEAKDTASEEASDKEA